MPDGPFKPGEKVVITGIYTATHDRHRLSHEVFAIAGEEFPKCRKCDDRIRFSLVHAASHIDIDPDFSRAKAASTAEPTGAQKKE